jgi:hypothetical protein
MSWSGWVAEGRGVLARPVEKEDQGRKERGRGGAGAAFLYQRAEVGDSPVG